MFSGNAAFAGAYGYLTSDDATPFTTAEEVLARNNQLYVNIHNAENADGELRGQIYRGSECFTVSAASVNEVATTVSMTAYPNPAGNSLSIVKDNFVTGEVLTLVNISGQVVKTITLNSNGQSVNVSDLNAGVYFLQGANAAALKVVKL